MEDVVDAADSLDLDNIVGRLAFCGAEELLNRSLLLGRLLGLLLPIVVHTNVLHAFLNLFSGLTFLVSVAEVDDLIECKLVLLELLDVDLRVRESNHDEAADLRKLTIFIRRQHKFVDAQISWWLADGSVLSDFFRRCTGLLELLALFAPSLG